MTAADIYKNRAMFDAINERVFGRSWHLIASPETFATDSVVPITVLERTLAEPLVVIRSPNGELNCFSNVCTHRGSILVQKSCSDSSLGCPYHGRRFSLDGKCLSAPGFKDVTGFPSQRDDLTRVQTHHWKNFLFANLSVDDSAIPFAQLIAAMEVRIGWLPVENFVFDPSSLREYTVQANWALYIENYLEGLHIPFVHPGLASTLDLKSYRNEVFDFSTLQIGIAASADEDCFELPPQSPDYGSKIAAYYFWIFPNMMFNFYPWGLSVNIVEPLDLELTKVTFKSYVWKEHLRNSGAGAALDQVEMEDQAIVSLVQKGVKSRFFKQCTYSPGWEDGVKRFHKLLNSAL